MNHDYDCSVDIWIKHPTGVFGPFSRVAMNNTPHRLEKALEKAIAENKIYRAGEYLVVATTQGDEIAEVFEVERVPTPQFRIKSHA